VFKIAGAAAEAGLDLDEVERLARRANDATRSIGVAFAGCTLPGASEPLFTVPPGKMSLGLGIHGEPGISEHDMPSASELAALLVQKLLGDRPDDAGTRVVPILNGLGTVKYDELFLLYGKIEKLLLAAGLEISEPECGELVTSLDMSGLSLTLLWLDDELATYWSAPADTPAFRKGAVTARAPRDVAALTETVAPAEQGTDAAIALGSLAVEALRVVREVVQANEEELGKLDSYAGDGDHGIGMRRGADAAAAAAEQADGTGVRNILTSAGEAWSERAGGTSGALWGTALINVGNALGNRDSYAASDAVAAVRAFVDAITELGGAAVGDKTMVDALLPFADAFTAEFGRNGDAGGALTAAARAATDAAAATAQLRPKKGRARPLAEKSVGHPDPGAVSFGLIATGVADRLSGLADRQGGNNSG
jgi:dihydroxyacetone kinase